MLAGAHAATSRNFQAHRFVFIEEPDGKRQLVEQCGMQDFVADAGLVVAGCAPREGLGAEVDVITCMAQMEAVAVSEGLGTCWLGMFREKPVAGLIDLPTGWRLVLMMAIGYPESEHFPRSKLPLEELFFAERVPASPAKPTSLASQEPPVVV